MEQMMHKKQNWKNSEQNPSFVIRKQQKCCLPERLLKKKKNSLETNLRKMNPKVLVLVIFHIWNHCISSAKNSLFFLRYRYGRILSKNKMDDKTYSTWKNQILQLFSRISQAWLNNLWYLILSCQISVYYVVSITAFIRQVTL